MIGSATMVEWSSEVTSSEMGVLALWSCVLQQAVADVAFGLRNGLLGQDLVPTAKRLEGDDTESRAAVAFLTGDDGARLCDLVSAASGMPVTTNFLLRLARAQGAREVKAIGGRPRIQDPQALQERQLMRQSYQRWYQAQRRERLRAQRAEGVAA